MLTTAGTGAEVTRFSVLYRNKDKESVSDYSIIPNFQIFDYTTLKSLPYEQKVVTSLDAFCHSVEAFGRLMQRTKAENTAKSTFPF